MSAFDFANAPRSFSCGKRVTLDGAFWAEGCIGAALLGLPAIPVHRLGLDWPRCFHSLGVALGRHELRRLEMQVAQQAWATSPIATRVAAWPASISRSIAAPILNFESSRPSAAGHAAQDAKERALEEHGYGGKEPVDPSKIVGLEDFIP